MPESNKAGEKSVKVPDFEIAGTKVKAGTRQIVDIPISLLSNHIPVNLTVNVVHGKRPGPVLFARGAGHGDEIVGEITSCAMGYRTGKCIALGMVRADCLAVGTALEVDVFGTRQKAVVQEDQPMWDPKNERIRA